MPTGMLVRHTNSTEKEVCKKPQQLVEADRGIRYRRDGGYQLSVLLTETLHEREIIHYLAKIAEKEKILLKNAQFFVVTQKVKGVEIYQCKIQITSPLESYVLDEDDEFSGLLQGVFLATKYYMVSYDWLAGKPSRKDYPFSREKVESLLS